MYKITAYTAKTSSKKYWCQYNLWTGDFPAYIVGCLITCSTHQIARSSGLVIWSFSVEPISLAASANFGSWRSLSRACNSKKNTMIRWFVNYELQNSWVCSNTLLYSKFEFANFFSSILSMIFQRAVCPLVYVVSSRLKYPFWVPSEALAQT